MHEAHEGPPPDPGERGKHKVVYTIIDKGPDRKGFFLRIGTAFVNRDQSWNVKLDAIPVNGTLHIRDYVPDDRPVGRRNDNDQSARGHAQNGVL